MQNRGAVNCPLALRGNPGVFARAASQDGTRVWSHWLRGVCQWGWQRSPAVDVTSLSLHCRRQKPESWYPIVSTLVSVDCSIQYKFPVSNQCCIPFTIHDSRFRSCKRKECEACQNHGRHEKRWGSWKSDSRNGEAWEIEFITRRVRPTVVRASANAASLLLYCSLTRPLAHSPVFPITPEPHLGSSPF